MNRIEKLAELRKLQTKADVLRQELGISAPGRIIYQAELDLTSHDTLLVEADGFGGATTSIVEGDYPLDYSSKFEKHFQTEREAENADGVPYNHSMVTHSAKQSRRGHAPAAPIG